MPHNTSPSDSSQYWFEKFRRSFQSLRHSHLFAKDKICDPVAQYTLKPCSQRKSAASNSRAEYAWRFLELISAVGLVILLIVSTIIVFGYQAFSAIGFGLWGGILFLGERLPALTPIAAYMGVRGLSMARSTTPAVTDMTEQRNGIIQQLQNLADSIPDSDDLAAPAKYETKLLCLDIIGAMNEKPDLSPASSLEDAFGKQFLRWPNDDGDDSQPYNPDYFKTEQRLSEYTRFNKQLTSLFALILNEVRKYEVMKQKSFASQAERTAASVYIPQLCEIALSMVEFMPLDSLSEPIFNTSKIREYDNNRRDCPANTPLTLAITVQSKALVQALFAKGLSPSGCIDSTSTSYDASVSCYEYAYRAISREEDDPQRPLALEIARTVFLAGVQASKDERGNSPRTDSTVTSDIFKKIDSSVQTQRQISLDLAQKLRNALLTERAPSPRELMDLTKNLERILWLLDDKPDCLLTRLYLIESAIILVQQGASLQQKIPLGMDPSRDRSIAETFSKRTFPDVAVLCEVLSAIEERPRPTFKSVL